VQIRCSSLRQGAEQANGLTVIIDVFRAFTTSPLLFELGVKELILVGRPEEGLELKQANPDLILVGEVSGVPIEGYDFGNCPSQILAHDPDFFPGRTAVLRTSAGVQGALLALQNASEVLLAGFVTARATARYILDKSPNLVSIVAMGLNMQQPAQEDESCAEYIASLLGQGEYLHDKAMKRLLFSPTTQRFMDPKQPHLPPLDPIICLQRDLYDLVIRAGMQDGLIMARPIRR
jgi:2-phosphosulfolactate phosphatase